MNLTTAALANAPTRRDKNDAPLQLTTGPVPVARPKPTISQLAEAMDAFNIRGTARLVGYELLSFWTPGGRVFPKVKTIAVRIGKSERAVQRHLEHLERVGVWVRCGPAPIGVKGKQPSLYEMRLPKSCGVTPTSPHGVTPASPRSNQVEVTNKNVQRKGCATCGSSWPAEYGSACYACLQARNGPKPRGGLPNYAFPGRSLSPDPPPLTAERKAEIEEQLGADPTWQRKEDGQWAMRY